MPASRHVRRLWLGLFVIGSIGVATVGWWFWDQLAGDTATPTRLVPDPPPPDPREVFDTPYRNVKPGVKYVGDAACARCHRDLSATYHAHPMGRSAAYLADTEPVEKFPADGPAEFAVGPYTLSVERSQEGQTHRLRLREPAPVPVPELVLPVQVAIGSGTRGRSYLTVDGGCVWQTPVSWFGPDEKWDLSPGFRLGKSIRRSIAPECLFCHTDHVESVAGAENEYRQPLFARQAAIGCERCHGPGELHVAERTNDPTPPARDTSIVNPRHLSPALQLAICEQCHLQGQERVTRRGRGVFEFRPGLPFEQFASVYVKHPEIAQENRSVGQFEQMEQSRCFTQSNGALTCTSCHDPHVSPTAETRAGHYRDRCLTCHQGAGAESVGCSLPAAERAAKANNCVACHMPKAASSNIIHASVTNHRVPRTPDAVPVRHGLPVGALPLVRFRSGRDLAAEELLRDYGIALARAAQKQTPGEAMVYGDLRRAAVERLTASLSHWPGDADAWSALALAHDNRTGAAEKLKAARAAVELAPQSEPALIALTDAATAAVELDLAAEAAGTRIALNPQSSDALVARAFVYLQLGDWVKAEQDCRAALAINPLHAESHLYLAICRHKQGDEAGGRKEADTAAQLEADPKEKAYLTGWYQRATR